MCRVGGCEQCHCVRKERDEAREVARTAVEAWQGHQERGHPPGCGFGKAEIAALKREHSWLNR